MTASFTAAMQEAARLTRAGDPAAATRVIQAALALDPMTARSWDGVSEPSASPQTALPALPAPAGVENADAADIELASPSTAAPAAQAQRGTGRPRRPRKRAPLAEVVRHLRVARPNLSPGGLPGRRAKPPAIPDGASFTEHRFASGAGSLSYKLYVPSALPAEPCPLVVMLHGCTQDPDDFAAGTRMNALAEEHGFLVVYPRQPHSANSSGCWNWFRPGDQRRDGGEPALIAGICHAVLAEHGVDRRRVYLAGLSAGGAMACVMAEAYPDLFAAIGIHSGLPTGSARDVASAFAAMRDGGGSRSAPVVGLSRVQRLAVPTIVFHGDADATVHPQNGEAVFERAAEAASLAAETVVERGRSAGGRAFTRRVLSAGETPVIEHWLVHGAGHAWSGGDPAGSYVDPTGPDASREMLRFFRHHAKGR